MRLPVLFAAAALLSATLAAHADVMYSYVGAGAHSGNTFTIDSLTFLTYSNSPVAVTTSSDLFSYGQDDGKLVSVIFRQGALTGFSDQGFLSTLFGTSYTINQDGAYTETALATAGTTLTISGSPNVTPVGATPEPSSIALLGTGLLYVASMVRRRLV